MAAPSAPVWLRPRDAVAAYRVAPSTLRAWAAAGLVGKSTVKISPAARRGTVYYRTADIEALLAGNERPRTAVPVPPAPRPPAPLPAAPAEWAADPVWHGGTAAPHAAPVARHIAKGRPA